MFKIGDFSKLSNVSIRMLRHYEKLGLIEPEYVDPGSGFRFYTAAQLKAVNKIQKLKALGFSLAVIKEITASESTDEVGKYLELRQKELQEELEQITAQFNMLDSVREIMKADESLMHYHVSLKTLPRRYVMSLREVIPTFEDEEMLWRKLYREMSAQKVRLASDSIAMAIYHDREYKEEHADIEVQSVVAGRAGDHTDTEAIRFYEAPVALTAAVTFQGGYEQMDQVTIALGRWLEDNGYGICGPLMNIFHVSPAQDRDSRNWVTETCIEIRKI